MSEIPTTHVLVLAALLLGLGITGLLVRRSLLFMLLSLEVMLNSAGLALVAAGAHWGNADGQVLFIFLLTMAAAELAVGLALVLLLFREQPTLDPDALHRLGD